MPGPANSLNISQSGLVNFDGVNSFTGVLVTQYDVLIGGPSNSIISVGPGLMGQILQSRGGSNIPEYSTATYPATAGSSGNILTSDGTNWNSSAAPSGGISVINVQNVTASGAFTYTPTANMAYVIVELVGGGGGSGGCASASGGNYSLTAGGASGGYARFMLTAAQVGSSLSGSIGIGGANGASGNHNGTPGGDTTLATASGWTVKGGGASAGSATTGVGTAVAHAGGTSSANTTGTGTVIANIQGQNGLYAFAPGSSTITPGNGGSSLLGLGGVGVVTINASTTNAGVAGTGYGAGAAGCSDGGQATAQAGASGTTGIAIFTEYCT